VKKEEYALYSLPWLGTIKCAEDLGRRINFLENLEEIQKNLPEEARDKLEYLLKKSIPQVRNYTIILIGKLLFSFISFPILPTYFASEMLSISVGLYLGMSKKKSQEEEMLELLEYFKD